MRWIAFALMAAAIIAGGLSKVNLHDPAALLAAVAVICPGLAGLCMHPPSAAATMPMSTLAASPPNNEVKQQ